MDLSKMFDLTGRVAIVTGGSKGIGKAMCHGLAQQGAHVVVSSRKLDQCEAAVDEIKAAGGEAVAIAANGAQLKKRLRTLRDTAAELEQRTNTSSEQQELKRSA